MREGVSQAGRRSGPGRTVLCGPQEVQVVQNVIPGGGLHVLQQRMQLERGLVVAVLLRRPLLLGLLWVVAVRLREVRVVLPHRARHHLIAGRRVVLQRLQGALTGERSRTSWYAVEGMRQGLREDGSGQRCRGRPAGGGSSGGSRWHTGSWHTGSRL